VFLLEAGHQSTMNALTSSVYTLLVHAPQLDRLRRDPSGIPCAHCPHCSSACRAFVWCGNPTGSARCLSVRSTNCASHGRRPLQTTERRPHQPNLGQFSDLRWRCAEHAVLFTQAMRDPCCPSAQSGWPRARPECL
jgi:hypothetical protein